MLSDGRPMVEFEERFKLYKFLEVPHLPLMHWSYSSAWMMATHMYDFVKQKMRDLINAASYIAVTCDESTGVDNTSWMAFYVYVMQNWSRKPLLITLQKLEADGATADALLSTITGILELHVGLDRDAIASKLVCFGADGVSAFQGHKKGVSK